jgi:hypothetical protein
MKDIKSYENMCKAKDNFKCNEISGMHLVDDGDDESTDSHWEMRFVGNKQ